ncbi:MAG: alkaline phosphatase family protein [Actinomycetota bacterium]|nr:alkaline phosphatase family protein [Actinomycetota bacterium]
MTAPSVVLPRYGQRALSDLLPGVAAALGLPGFTDHLGLPAARRYVVVLVDGLGQDLLELHRDAAPYLASLLDREPLTSGVPSTTVTSLTSLGTGLAPGRHGVVGYTSRIPGTNRLLNALKWPADVDPLAWQPHPTVFERMAEAGGMAAAVNRTSFEGSGLTVCSQRGAVYHSADTPWERLSVVAEVAKAEQSLTYAYESTLDHHGHEIGCTSPEWLARLAGVDTDLLRLRAALPADAVLVVTADHGMIDLALRGRMDVDDYPGLLDDVVLVGGEARLRHLYCRAGAADDVAQRWREDLDDRAVVLTRDDAVAAGWFGPLDPRVRPRLGDVLVAGLGDFATFSRRLFPVEGRMVGFHGSLTAAEMLVPLLVDAPRG